MTLQGSCKLLKIYVNEDAQFEKHSLYKTIVSTLKTLHMAGVTVSRGIEGFGEKGQLHSAHILDLSLSLPIVIEAVDTADKIETASAEISKILNAEGLMFICDVHVVGRSTSK